MEEQVDTKKVLLLSDRIRALEKKGFKFYVSSAPSSVGLIPPGPYAAVLRTWYTEVQVEKLLTDIESDCAAIQTSPYMEELMKQLGPVLIPSNP